jgi:tRNA G10  N-methylase Trm11
MTTLYAVLGNTPALSLLELSAVTNSEVFLLMPNLAKLETSLSAGKLGQLLGGTIKLVSALKTTTKQDLLQDLTGLIQQTESKNVAITSMTTVSHLAEGEVHSIKKEVTKTRPIRFLSLATQNHSLVALRKQHVAEFVIFADDGVLTIGETVWIQDADDWTKLDRSKPYRDIKKGMLPPKVARIMVNLGQCGQAGLTLADPFCGTGTILLEAALTGSARVIGSDTDEASILGSAKNLAWLKNSYPELDFTSELFKADATHLDEHVKNFDVVVTEPYMGPLLDLKHLPPKEKIKNIARGLSKLYLGALKSWHKCLPEKGRVVISIPSFNLGTRSYPTLAIDDYARLGYNYISSVAYSKIDATVIRNITILEKLEQ